MIANSRSQFTSMTSGMSSRRVRAAAVVPAMALVALAVVGLMSPATASAQGGMITGPINAAKKAAAATNANTSAMQDVNAATQAPPAAAQHAATPAAAPAAPTHTVSIPHLATTGTSGLALPATAAKPAAAASKSAVPATVPGKPVMSEASTKPAAATTKAVAAAPAAATPAAKSAAVVAAPAVAAKPAAGAADAAGPDTGMRSISVTQRGTKGEVSLNREVFSYDAGARRDPFVSLMRTGDLRPMLSDLRLVLVMYDATGRNSVAVMRDQSTKDQYRVRVGETLGRMRVAQIEPKDVVFTIEEVGFSRQEALALGDSTKARKQ